MARSDVSPKVLLVVPDDWLSRLLMWVLESEGCVVARVTSPGASESLIGSMRPDVIVLHYDREFGDCAVMVDSWQASGSRVVNLWQRSPDLDGRSPRPDIGADADLEMPFEVQDLPELVLRLAGTPGRHSRAAPKRPAQG